MYVHVYIRPGSGTHLCMQHDKNGRKMMVLPSADKKRLTHFLLSKINIFTRERPSL
jgi:hypothetical protein